MNTIDIILKELEGNNYSISTDTRKDVAGSVYFALTGENFDGSAFIEDALAKGAVAVVTENKSKAGEHVYVVDSVLTALQKASTAYRALFNIPLIALGGSNGKTTSKELLKEALKSKYKVHATEGSLNNHIGVPLTLFSMPQDTEIGIFEIGANHPKEHLDLLEILNPTHVVVTNNGMDHLEGFGSPLGSRLANKEIYDWAKENNAKTFVHKNHPDLIEDSTGIERILYPEYTLATVPGTFLSFSYDDKKYTTQMIGNYNLENVELAVSIGQYFGVKKEDALDAVCNYAPSSRRSQFIQKDNIDFIVDCYNANPTSMKLSLDSFLTSAASQKGVILGDMLELGEYADDEHKKIVEYVLSAPLTTRIFIGIFFKKALADISGDFKWFETSDEAKIWFDQQNFSGFTFLLKGSRGLKMEKILV
ncbi:MAG: UDP-N-acetylmuramoyl-tripeptide--D-alanyl-D-alanine ligase [Candidatus Zambryskibacteria bacterium]|nr:UDP-N-acetylmuramoyl-tripeptide--D-alanyl-D-alanine ligase [Candidatus Zambryskibacteria bacterium]